MLFSNSLQAYCPAVGSCSRQGRHHEVPGQFDCNRRARSVDASIEPEAGVLRSYTFAKEAAPAQVHIVPALSAYSLNATRRQEVKADVPGGFIAPVLWPRHVRPKPSRAEQDSPFKFTLLCMVSCFMSPLDHCRF